MMNSRARGYKPHWKVRVSDSNVYDMRNPNLVVSISIGDFGKIEMRIGRIAAVDDIPTARKPMYKLTVEFGDGQTKQCVAGIKGSYTKEDLAGRLVVAVTNLQPKMVAGVPSECMLLAAFNDEAISLLSPDKQLPVGTKVG